MTPPESEISRFSVELKLLLACLSLRREEGMLEFGNIISAESVSWQTFLALLEQHGVMSFVYRMLSAGDEDWVPSDVRRDLLRRVEQNTTACLDIAVELVRITSLLEHEHIPVIAIKGPAFSTQVFGDPAFRQRGDLDLLIPAHLADKGDRIMVEAGYDRSIPSFELTSTQQKRFKGLICHFTYSCPRTRLSVELHWRLFSVNAALPMLFDDLLARSCNVELGGRSIAVPSWDDMILILCAHGAKHVWSRLHMLHDLNAVIDADNDLDWSSLLAQAEKLNVRRALTQASFLRHLLLRGTLPEGIRSAAANDHVIPGLVRQALRCIQGVVPTRSRLWSGSQLLRYHLKLCRNPGYKLKMVRDVFVDPGNWRTVPLPDVLFPLHYLLRPFFWAWRRVFREAQT